MSATIERIWRRTCHIVRITDIDGHIEYINFAKEYGSKKGQQHPIWRRVICGQELWFKNDNPDKIKWLKETTAQCTDVIMTEDILKGIEES